MFLPPEQRPVPGPSDLPQPKRQLTRREETFLLWAVGFVVVTLLLAPIGGSTLVDALRYLVRR